MMRAELSAWKEELKALAPVVPHALKLAVDAPGLIPWAPTGPDTALRRAVRRHGDRPALLFEERRWTWRSFEQDVDRHASQLARTGPPAGGCVALLMDNRPEYLLLFHALSRLGVAASLINTGLNGAALAHALRACNATHVLVGIEHAQTLAALNEDERELLRSLNVQVVPDVGTRSIELPDPSFRWFHPDPMGSRAPWRFQHNKEVCCYIYTSGTTGLPKAAVMRNQRIIGAGELFGHLMHQTGRDEVIYIMLPLYHTNGMGIGWASALMTGAAAALRRRFSASRFWDDVVQYRATSFVYIGEVCRYLAQSPPHPLERAHRLRVGVGNGMRSEVGAVFAERFGVPTMREFYGATEGNAITMNIEGVPGMMGRMLPSQQIVRCDTDTGELIRGADGFCQPVEIGESGLLLGRLNPLLAFDGYADEQATESKILHDVLTKGDAWFNTGDLVQRHPRRWMSFVDRLGDTYRWKGENVSTTEVGSLLSAAPGVVECVVYGVEVPGAEGRAGMVALLGDERFRMEDFAAHVRAQVPRFQQPRFVRLLSGQIETTGTFKLRKVVYQKQGLEQTGEDCVFVLQGNGYVPFDRDAFRTGALSIP